MPRDMTGTGRYPPQPRYSPFSFYSAIRLGDPELLGIIMSHDPYFITQDNGAGAPIHFAVTYRQLDMVHHLLNSGAEVNQQDPKGLTPLHRAAYLAHLDGYLELYEYLLSQGADPSICSLDSDPYLDPGCKLPTQLAATESTRAALIELERKYSGTAKARRPHPDIGDWWTLYDYGSAVASWDFTYKQVYPEERWRSRHSDLKKAERAERKLRRQQFYKALEEAGPEAAASVAHSVISSMHSGSASSIQTLPPSLALEPAGPPTPPAAFLFPGQGSQAVGMLKDCHQIPAVRSMLDKANDVLGYNLLDVCLNGPKEKLDNTCFAQPALFVAGLAAVEVLRSTDPSALSRCVAAAGLSLGEYSALVFAGALSFEDGLKVVKVRCEAMAAAAEAKEGRSHCMLSVVGLEDETLRELCAQALDQTPPGSVCQIANYLFPKGRVISGHLEALEVVQKTAMERGAMKVVMLAVSGAFHTSLMGPARAKLEKVLEEVEWHEPRIPVFSNVTANSIDNANMIPGLLASQLVEPVMWEGCLKQILKMEGPPEVYELGPGQQIKAMVKRVDMGAWKLMKNVSV